MRLQIIIDTREQTPWAFDPAQADTEIGTLKTGDYAINGDEQNFAIERKTLDDFLGTISSGWERFLREIGRMDSFTAKIVIVEADFIGTCFTTTDDGRIHPPKNSHPMLTPQFISMRIAELLLMGVSVVFGCTADLSCAMATSIFRQRQKQIEVEDDN